MDLSTTLRKFHLSQSLLIVAALATVGTYAVVDTNAHVGGITGATQKPGSTNGCTCHCPSASTATTVSVTTTATSFSPSTSYTFTATVANSGESDGGIDVANYRG
jgi:hypothetical protein